jgi:hypothetical protein
MPKGNTPKKRINPKCPVCERRVPFVLDLFVNGKRIRLCSHCHAEYIKVQEIKVVRQLRLIDEQGKPIGGAEEYE